MRIVATMAFLVMLLLMATVSPHAETSVEAEVCTSIEERMPMGKAASFPADVDEVCLWTRVTGATDTTFVTHVWSHNGVEKASVELPVRSTNWRTWSRKKILPEWLGDWEVKVKDASGTVLATVAFKIVATTE